MINKVELIGNLGADASWDGNIKRPVKLRLATNERYTDSDGKTQFRTTWHNVSVWGSEKLRKYVSEAYKKGDLVRVEGSIKYNIVEDKTYVDISCFDIKNLSGLKKTSDSGEISKPANRESSKTKSNDEEEGYDLPF